MKRIRVTRPGAVSVPRQPGRRLLVMAACGALAVAGAGGTGRSAAAPAEPKSTFGRQPCGRLVSVEEVETAFRASVPMIDVVEEGTCVYESAPRLPLLRVRVTTGAGLRCATPHGATEKLAGIGDQAVWSGSAGTLCFVKGDARVQLSFDSPLPKGADPKTVAAGLARKAAARLPLSPRP